MVFSAGSQIRGYYITSQNLFRVASKLGQVAGIGYDGFHIYWTNVMQGDEAIIRSNEDGSEQEVLVSAGEKLFYFIYSGLFWPNCDLNLFFFLPQVLAFLKILPWIGSPRMSTSQTPRRSTLVFATRMALLVQFLSMKISTSLGV